MSIGVSRWMLPNFSMCPMDEYLTFVTEVKPWRWLIAALLIQLCKMQDWCLILGLTFVPKMLLRYEVGCYCSSSLESHENSELLRTDIVGLYRPTTLWALSWPTTRLAGASVLSILSEDGEFEGSNVTRSYLLVWPTRCLVPTFECLSSILCDLVNWSCWLLCQILDVIDVDTLPWREQEKRDLA